jgi:MFS family permease
MTAVAAAPSTASPTAIASSAPAKAGLVLLAFILVEAVANLDLTVANVALPTIADAFDAPQAAVDLVAVSYSLGLAASVLWLGAQAAPLGRIAAKHAVRPAGRHAAVQAALAPGPAGTSRTVPPAPGQAVAPRRSASHPAVRMLTAQHPARTAAPAIPAPRPTIGERIPMSGG